jgi:hypothetical protein
MSLMFSAEKTKMKRKNSWNNPRGLRSTAYIRMYCFELGYRSLREFRFFVCRIYICVMFSDCFTYASIKIGQSAILTDLVNVFVH